MHGLAAPASDSAAGAWSAPPAFGPEGKGKALLAAAPHGTAPALEGKTVANPMAMIMAVASLFGHMEGTRERSASRAIYEATLETVSDGIRTADLGGHSGTPEFTDEVIPRVRPNPDVLASLAAVR